MQSAQSVQGMRITLIGSVVNLALVGLKILSGLLVGSIALIADGIHSLSDLATDVAVIGGMRIARRKADETHPYGHGKFETLAGGLVAVALVGVGFYIAWESGIALYRHESNLPGPAVLVVALISIVSKELLYRWTEKTARSTGSAALHANAWHHRSDALSSVAVLAGGAGGLAGWEHADQMAGLLVGFMVCASGAKTLFDVIYELTEGAVSRKECADIETAVTCVPGVKSWHRLRTRRVGREVFIDLHVIVEPDLKLVDSHRISMEVENRVRDSCKYPVNVMVHMEPDLPELQWHHEA